MDFKKYSVYLEQRLNDCKKHNDILNETLECCFTNHDLNKCKNIFNDLIYVDHCNYHKKKLLNIYIGDDTKEKEN